MNRYYSIMRPVGIGTFPKPAGNRIINIENFDDRQYVPEIDRKAWGYIDYEYPLAESDANSYELRKGEKL